MAIHSSILLNSMERGTVHWVAKNWTWLRNFHFHAIIQFLLFKSNTKFAILYRQIVHCLSVSLRVKVEIPSMANRMLWSAVFTSLTSSGLSPFGHSISDTLTVNILPVHQGCSCLRAFSLVLPFVLNIFYPHTYVAPTLSHSSVSSAITLSVRSTLTVLFKIAINLMLPAHRVSLYLL